MPNPPNFSLTPFKVVELLLRPKASKVRLLPHQRVWLRLASSSNSRRLIGTQTIEVALLASTTTVTGRKTRMRKAGNPVASRWDARLSDRQSLQINK
jgi:hypothetical protein